MFNTLQQETHNIVEEDSKRMEENSKRTTEKININFNDKFKTQESMFA